MPHADLGANVWTNPANSTGRRHRQRWQRLRGRRPRLGLRRQRQHHLRRHRRTTTARTSPARSAPRAATAIGRRRHQLERHDDSGEVPRRRGGTTANAVKARRLPHDLKTRHGINIVATNNSWGGGGFSQALLDAINRGGDAGILFIAAAGNGGSDGVGDNNDTTADLSVELRLPEHLRRLRDRRRGASPAPARSRASRTTARPRSISARPARRSSRRCRARPARPATRRIAAPRWPRRMSPAQPRCMRRRIPARRRPRSRQPSSTARRRPRRWRAAPSPAAA